MVPVDADRPPIRFPAPIADAADEEEHFMNNNVVVGLVIAGVMISAAAFSAPPTKASATPSAAIIAGSAGTTVGPLVPVVATANIAAALYRSNGASVKVLFDGAAAYTSRHDAAISRTLRIVGPYIIRFPLSYDCTGQGYLTDVDFARSDSSPGTYVLKPVANEFKGYAPMAVYPTWPNRAARPVLVNIDPTPVAPLPGIAGSAITPDGLCTINVITAMVPIDTGAMYAVSVATDLNWSGPYAIK